MTQESCPTDAQLRRLIAGEITADEQTALARHIDRCADCQSAMERLSGGESFGDIADRLGEPQVLDSALANVLDELQADSGPQETEAAPHLALEATLPPRPVVATNRFDFLESANSPGKLGRLGHYDILDVVGKGGMGIVFRGQDTKLQRIVAIKAMMPELAAIASARQRFVREARAAAAVSHEHVVTIHAVHEEHAPPYLVMQFVAGRSLQQRIDESGALHLKEILRIGLQAASGLAAAHAQGLVHRDIKPANILLENGVERVKITDFGLARVGDDSRLTQTGVVTGTPQYMAPEQARGEPVDHRADLFSLGGVLYAMCTGYAPFRASSSMAVLKKVCDEHPRPIRDLNPEIPNWLVAIVERLMAKDPNQRFQSAAEVATLLEQHLAHLQRPAAVPMPAPVMPPEKVPPPAAAGPPLLLPLLLILAPIAVLGLLFFVSAIAVKPIWGVFELLICGLVIGGPSILAGLALLFFRSAAKPASGSAGASATPAGAAAKPQRTPSWAPIVLVVLIVLLLCPGSIIGLGVGLYWLSPQPGEGDSPDQSRGPRTEGFSTSDVPSNRVGRERILEGLSWFPADATFFGVIDFQRSGSLSIESPLVQALLNMLAPPKDRRLFSSDNFADMRLERIAFAIVEQPQKPGDTRVFLRFTGSFHRVRLKRLILEHYPEASAREGAGIEEYTTTVVSIPKTGLDIALVGEEDIVFAGFPSDRSNEKRHGQALKEVLEYRIDPNGVSWDRRNLTRGSYASELNKLPLDAVAVLMGDVPAPERDALSAGKGGPFRVAPRFMTVVGTWEPLRSPRVRATVRLPGAADVPTFVQDFKVLRDRWIADVAKMSAGPERKLTPSAADVISRQLEQITIEANSANVTFEGDFSDEAQKALLEFLRAAGPFHGSAAVAVESLKRFDPKVDKPITQEAMGRKVSADEGGWRVQRAQAMEEPFLKSAPATVLFELRRPAVVNRRITVRAMVKTEGKAPASQSCLGMDFGSEGGPRFDQLGPTRDGSTDWAPYEFSFDYPAAAPAPDVLRLTARIVFEGSIWIKNLEVVTTPSSPRPPLAAPKRD